VFESCSTRLSQHKADSDSSDTGHKVLTAQGWFYNFRLSRSVDNLLWISFRGFIKVGNVHYRILWLFSWCGPDCQSGSYSEYDL